MGYAGGSNWSFEVLSRTVAGQWGETKPFLSEPEWCQLFVDSGFSGVDISLADVRISIDAHTLTDFDIVRRNARINRHALHRE